MACARLSSYRLLKSLAISISICRSVLWLRPTAVPMSTLSTSTPSRADERVGSGVQVGVGRTRRHPAEGDGAGAPVWE